MCIICNCPGREEAADAFLVEFAGAQMRMKAAAEAMLLVSKVAEHGSRARYDMLHKEMVRQIREWNKLEEKREHVAPR